MSHKLSLSNVWLHLKLHINYGRCACNCDITVFLSIIYDMIILYACYYFKLFHHRMFSHDRMETIVTLTVGRSHRKIFSHLRCPSNLLIHQLRGLCYKSGAALWLCWYLAINSTQWFCHFLTSTKQFLISVRIGFIRERGGHCSKHTWLNGLCWLEMNTSYFVLCTNRSSCVTLRPPAVSKAGQAWTPHLVIHENCLGLRWQDHHALFFNSWPG